MTPLTFLDNWATQGRPVFCLLRLTSNKEGQPSRHFRGHFLVAFVTSARNRSHPLLSCSAAAVPSSALTRSLSFPLSLVGLFHISLTGSTNYGFSKQISDSSWGEPAATAGDKMIQLAGVEACQELQSNFRDGTKRTATFDGLRRN